MRRVILESPYAADTPDGINENIEYARRAIRDCLVRDDAPIASHLLFTQPGILRDEVPDERALGMKAGMTWTPVAEAVVVYTDRGVTRGMKAGIARAERAGIPVEYRTLGGAEETSPQQLRELLLRIGHDVRVELLVQHAASEHEVRAAVAWAQDQLKGESDAHNPFARVPCPHWLEDLLEPLPPTSP
jgi:hypothetical protein